jgi:hypothetical protein
MYDMYAFTKTKHGGNGLYNASDRLWWRDKDFVPPYKEPNGEDCYWARGNGWVVAALAKTLEALPKTDPHYEEYLTDFKNMIAALLPLQRKDGYDVSLHTRIILVEKFLEIVIYLWNVLGELITTSGGANLFVTIIRPERDVERMCSFRWEIRICTRYRQRTKDGQLYDKDKTPDFGDYGLGCFLFIGTELYR